MIRVLQFADLVNRYDFIDNIIQYADRNRFEIGLCVRSAMSNIETPVYGDYTPVWRLEGLSRWNVPWTVIRLTHLLRSWQPNILHTHHFDQAVIGWLATLLYPKTRLVIGRHYSDSIYRSPSQVKKRALLALENATNRAAARIVVPSTQISKLLVECQHVPPGKVDRVPYGFVPAKYKTVAPHAVRQVREELGLQNKMVLGNFSRLHIEKGHTFLLRAMADLCKEYDNLQLLVVGEGPERAALERQVQAARLGDRVRLLGWRLDAMTLMAAVDIVVQPTLQEAFSQVMAEALWMGKPLIITDISGASDILCDGVNGLIVPPASVPALTSAIRRLVQDEPLRARMADSGRVYVEDHLTIEKIIPLYEQVYHRALSSNAASRVA